MFGRAKKVDDSEEEEEGDGGGSDVSDGPSASPARAARATRASRVSKEAPIAPASSPTPGTMALPVTHGAELAWGLCVEVSLTSMTYKVAFEKPNSKYI